MIYSRPLLETFLAVCKHGNFSQAAVVLDKSQSCVSMQITHIERELGLPLLDRSARPLTLTDAGMKFLEFAKAILRTIDECSGYMKDMAAGSVGELKIGTSTSIGTFLLPPVLANIVKAFPNVSIHINVLGRPAVYEALRQGEIHFGIVVTHNPPPEFLATRIRSEPLYFVSSGTHPLARKRSVSIQELLKTPFVIGTPWHDSMINQALRTIGVDNYPVALRISSLEGMKRAVGSGIGLGILPRFAIDEDLKRGTLSRVHVKRANFTGSLILLERRKVFSIPTVEHIKKIFLKELTNRAIRD